MRATFTAGRRVLALTAAVLVVAVTAAVAAGAASADPVTGSDANGTYLALGDSVAFGYVPPNAVPAPNYRDAHSFIGYPEYLAQQLNERVSNAFPLLLGYRPLFIIDQLEDEEIQLFA